MQKKLLALAVAGALAAPMAVQAQGSNVQIYGVLNPSVDFIDNGDDSGAVMSNNSSRIGFKGSEDLGNGLKAIFQLESAVDIDNRGGAGWTARDSWAGLAGSFGTVQLGNMFSAYKTSTNFVDPFGDTIGDYNNVFSRSTFGSFDKRFENAINYISPNFGGFSVMATYGLINDLDGDGFEDDSGNSDNDSLSLAATYKTGGLTLVAAYENQGESATVEDIRAFKLAAGYKFGSTAVALAWAKEDYGQLRATNVDRERDVIHASVKHSMGNIDLLASYTWADDFDDIDDSGIDAFAVGAAYNFSKRTQIGAYYSHLKVDDAVRPVFASANYAGTITGEDAKGFSIRLHHSF